MEVRNQRLPTDTHFAVHQNLATHLLSTVDEIVRLVPIPAITSIVPGPLSLPHSPYSSVDMMPIIKMMPITWWIIQPSQLSWSYLSRSVSSTSHSLMLRYLNTAGKKLSISLKNTISFSNRLKWSSLNCKIFRVSLLQGGPFLVFLSDPSPIIGNACQ